MSARIEKLVGMATLEGLPLAGYRRFGVPPGGAFDQESHLLANSLLGNEVGALTIELSNAEIEVAFSSPTRLAVVGAPSDYANSSFDAPTSGSIKIGAPRTGLRVYLAILNGWTPDGIDSKLARSGRRLAAGDVLEHGEPELTSRQERLANNPGSLDERPIRILKGPQPLIDIQGRNLTVSNQSDRTGVRLDGMSPVAFDEITSEPACAGAIQLTPSGQLIVIGPDGPTIGGYPKVAVVCSADLDRLAQLRPGQSIRFELIDQDRAKQLAQERQTRLARTLAQLNVTRR